MKTTHITDSLIYNHLNIPLAYGAGLLIFKILLVLTTFFRSNILKQIILQ